MATGSADHISRDQEISRSTERKQRLPKGKRADGVYQGRAAARAPTNISGVWRRLEQAEQRESCARKKVSGTRSHWWFFIGVMKEEVSSLEVRGLTWSVWGRIEYLFGSRGSNEEVLSP